MEEIQDLLEKYSFHIIPTDVTEIYQKYMTLDPIDIQSYKDKNCELQRRLSFFQLSVVEVNSCTLNSKSSVIKLLNKEIDYMRSSISNNNDKIRQLEDRLRKIQKEYRTMYFGGPCCCVGDEWYEHGYRQYI